MSEDILLVSIEAGIAELTFHRPAGLNAINVELATRLADTLTSLEQNTDVKVVVLKGAGRAFMAGGDLQAFHDAGENAPEAVKALIDPFHRIVRAIRHSRLIFIASVHGAAAGGGLALALACDFVIAASDAVFTPAYLRIATNPDGGTTWSVAALLGERRALEWLILGDPLSAEQVAGQGIINRVVPRDSLEVEVHALAARLVAGPAQAQASLKRLVWQARHTSLNAQLDAEAAGFTALAATADFREGVAAFLQRRAPEFQ